MKKLLLHEKFMMGLVLLNVAAIFIQECGIDNIILTIIDIVCSAFFVAEMIVKHLEYGLKGYWQNGWNMLDGIVTLITLPALTAYFVPNVADYGFIIACGPCVYLNYSVQPDAFLTSKKYGMVSHLPYDNQQLSYWHIS